jgi:hypothetical protein
MPAPPTGSLGAKPHRGGIVLALGICSIVFAGACGIGLILGIIGWIMGKNDMADIDAGRMDSSGRGLVQAGKICSIIGTVLGSLGIIITILYFILVIGIFAVGAAGAAGSAGGP